MANIPLSSIKFPGLPDKYTVPVVDNTLTTTGAAADAKKVGDELTSVKADLSHIFSNAAKTALLNCFANVSWLGTDGAELYNTLAEALEVEVDVLTGDVIELGGLLYGADIVGFGSAIGVYAENKSKSALPNDYEWELPTGYSFITENKTLHIDGVYTGTSTSIGGYIYEGSMKASQSSGTYDALIKNDGKSYTASIYAKNLKEGQYLDCRFRTIGTGGTTYFHTVNVTASNPYFKKTFTAEEMATLGANLGIGIYYYYGDDKNFDDLQIRIAVSDADDASQYVTAISGQTFIAPMNNCLAISDNVVSIKKREGAA